MRPLPRAIMPGKTRRLVSIGPFRFTSTERHQASGAVSAKGAIGPITPALLTSRSTAPNDCSMAANATSTAPASVMSAGKACACPPARPISPTVSASSASDRATTATEQPTPARACAKARPRPRPPPVTTATIPFRSTGLVIAASSINVHPRFRRPLRSGRCPTEPSSAGAAAASWPPKFRRIPLPGR